MAGRSKWLIGLLLFFRTILSVFVVLNAFFLRRIINFAAAGQAEAFLKTVFLWIGFIALRILVSVAARYASDYSASTVANRFKGQLFSVLLKGDYASVSQVHSGEWMNRLTSDVDVVADGAVNIIPGFVGTLVQLIGAVAALLWLEPLFLYVLIPGGLVLAFFTYAFRKVLKRLHKQIQEADGKLRIFLQERLGSLITVHAFAREQASGEQAELLMDTHKRARMRRSNFSNVCNAGFSGAMNITYILGVLFCGYGLIEGTMSYGNLMAVLQLVGQVQSPFANVTGYLPRYYAMIASAERLMEAEQFCKPQTELLEEQKIIDFYDQSFGAIVLDNVGFTYKPPVQSEQDEEESTLVFENYSLTIRKGEYLAFTGPSGCGKSTVLKLLMCLYSPDSGERYLETADGQIPLTEAYRRLFAYVPQGNHLMTGTIREIITFGDSEKMAMDGKLRLALRTACADEFVDELEKGIDTQLGEHGAGLSEGQMQRIAIARAVFSEHPILLLDEATSALDEATSVRLLNNLRSLTDMTVILVTHRTNHMELFDREIVFGEYSEE